VKVEPTALPEVLRIEPRVFGDARGSFCEVWHAERYRREVTPLAFVQDSVSVSRRGVLRGLHYQHPHAQGKLAMVLEGEAYDVAVDIRVGSPTFGRWVGEELSATNGRQLWIPPGFAHGFQALTERVVFAYKVTDVFVAEADRVIRYDDPAIGIPWPLPQPIVSAKDAGARRLADVPRDHLPTFP
jgi:dTDP-4-dehydrorhamnose 3,5-epimerase